MNVRNVTKEDLTKLAELISCEELSTRDDVSFDHNAFVYVQTYESTILTNKTLI